MTADADFDKIRQEIEGARTEKEKRREMTSGQVKKTIYGDMKFIIKVDLPVAMPEDVFKRYMAEYGNILAEAFSGK